MAPVALAHRYKDLLTLELPLELIYTFPLQAIARLACCCSYLARSLREEIEAARRPTLLRRLAQKVPSVRVSSDALTIEWDAIRVASDTHPPSAPHNAPLGSRLMWDRAALDGYELEEAAATAWDENGQFIAHGFSVISLSGNAIGSRGVQALCPMLKAMGPRLCDLQLQACALDDHCVVALCDALRGVNNGALQRLWLGSNAIGDGGCGAIAFALQDSAALSRSLQVLSLDDNRIGDVGAHALAAAISAGRMSSGKQLWLAGNPRISIAGQAALINACANWVGLFLQLITTVHVEM